jgi:hypothetical protein
MNAKVLQYNGLQRHWYCQLLATSLPHEGFFFAQGRCDEVMWFEVGPTS